MTDESDVKDISFNVLDYIVECASDPDRAWIVFKGDVEIANLLRDKGYIELRKGEWKGENPNWTYAKMTSKAAELYLSLAKQVERELDL